VRPLRIVVWDRSASIRSLVQRILSGVEGLEVRQERPGSPGRVGGEPSADIVILGSGDPVGGRRYLSRFDGPDQPKVILLTLPGELRGDAARSSLVGSGVSILPKPATTDGWDRLGPQLIALVTDLAAACCDGGSGPSPSVVGVHTGPVAVRRPFRLVVVGASSGGPSALHALLGSLGGGLWPGVAVVQHITPGFEEELVHWLAQDLEMNVAVARDGEPLQPGTVRIAPAGVQLGVEGARTLRLDRSAPPRGGHRPSVDELFFSIGEAMLPETLAILLDGMGRDGVEGLRRIRTGGGTTVVQDPESCVVAGMPLAALEAGAVMHALAPEAIGRFLRDAGAWGEER